MAGFLAYWKEYWQRSNTDQAALDWTTDSKTFYDTVSPGDTIWGVISGTEGQSDKWYLLERVFVKSKKAGGATKHGYYYFEADKKRSRQFELKRQPDFTSVLWLMQFRSGRHIRFIGAKIGRTLQSHGHRNLSHRDVALLEEYADVLVEMGPMIS